MKAFILTAGRGTRLQPLTWQRPKPMLPVLNKPVLQHIVEHLVKHGFTEIMMNPGYQGDQIESYFGSGEQFGASIYYLPEMLEVDGGVSAFPRGSASSLAVAQHVYQFFDEPVLVLCGDAIIDLDLSLAMASHKASNASASVFLQEVSAKDAHKYGIAHVDACGRIQKFVEKPKRVNESHCLANTGIYIFSPEVVNSVSSFYNVDIGSDLLPKLITNNKKVMGFVPTFNWFDIGTVADYKRVNHIVHAIEGSCNLNSALNKRPGQFDICKTELKGCYAKRFDMRNGLATIGNACIIDSGVEFRGNVIVGNNCIIENGCTVENSIIDSYCHLPAGCHLKNAILTSNWLITFRDSGEVDKAIQLHSGSSRYWFQSLKEDVLLSNSA